MLAKLLRDLEPTFVKIIEPGRRYRVDVSIDEADGVQFLCPLCYETNGGPVGTHGVLCWRPRVPLSEFPGPGRWEFTGTGFDNLSLVAGSSSVLLGGNGGCHAHFHVTNGRVTPC